MSQLSGPVVAMGLVLSAVFVPCAFISGITGQFFRQFALTIAASTIISTINSLTLSPALSAFLLRPRNGGTRDVLPRLLYVLVGGWMAYEYLGPFLAGWGSLRLASWPRIMAVVGPAAPWAAAAAGAAAGWAASRLVNFVLGWAFGLFNRSFNATAGAYTRSVGILLRVVPLVLVVYGGLLFLTYRNFMATPKGFIPSQDMGYALLNIQLPDAAPGVKHTLEMSGISFFLQANSSNFGSMFVILDDFSKREGPGLYAEEIVAKLQKRCAIEVPEAMIAIMGAPPVRGVGRTGGFKVMVEDRGDAGLRALQQQTDNLAEKAGHEPGPRGRPQLNVMPNIFRADTPQLYVNVDRKQCLTLGVALGDVFDTLQIYLGSLYVNDFNRFGRTWQVIVQAAAEFRNQVDQVRRLKVRNSSGGMVPLGTVAHVREDSGPLMITRYNMYPAAAINGAGGPGVSSRQAIDLVERVAARELSDAMRCEWTEMAYLEIQAGNTAMAIFGLSVLMVFLVLAAQYESWSMPLAVILVVPMCLYSAVLGVSAVPLGFTALSGWLGHISPHLAQILAGRGVRMDINIFTQIGFVVLVGLASKNAILIVEFARRQRAAGASRRDAALAACRLRLRPIVMTSFAFILGVFPLLIGRGAGAEMRRTLGTAVFSGMLGVTLFGIFLTPVFFTMIDWLGGSRQAAASGQPAAGNGMRDDSHKP
jgi:multidrug efflux pump